MKNINTNTVLQIVALLFLVILGYMAFKSESKWGVIKKDLNDAIDSIKVSQETLKSTKEELEKSKKDFERMKAQKDLLIHQRDSLIFDFKKKNAKDWEELQRIKDSIRATNNKLAKDKAIIDGLFGIN